MKINNNIHCYNFILQWKYNNAFKAFFWSKIDNKGLSSFDFSFSVSCLCSVYKLYELIIPRTRTDYK